MKKKLALLIATVLAISTIFSLAPVASASEEATVAPSQEIKYFNVSIMADVELLFAVPAAGYTYDKDAGFTDVKLLVWEDASSSGNYLYNDENAVTLTPELGAASIGGVQHVVFKYSDLSAAEMSKVVYARAVYTDEKGLRSYGDLYDYSIAEFANNYLSSPDTAHKSLVESMMDYGYFVALRTGSSSYTADEVKKLGKVSVTVNIDGANAFVSTTQLAKAGEEIELVAPHVDGMTFLGWDASVVDGKVTMDADGVSVVASYRSKTYYDADADFYGVGMNLNTLDGPDSAVGANGKAMNNSTATNTTYSGFKLLKPAHAVSDLGLNFSGRTTIYGSEAEDGSKTNYRRYHGLKTVADPDGDGLVFQFTNTEYGGYTFTLNNIASTGFGENVDPIINFSFRIGSINGRIGNLGSFYHRFRFKDSSTNKQTDLDTYFFRIVNGKIQIQNAKYNVWKDAITIPADDKMHEYTLSIDTRALTYSIYAEDEDGNRYAAVDSETIIHKSDFSAYYNNESYKLGSFENFFKGSFGEGVKSGYASSFTWTGASNWGSGDNALVDLDGDGVATDKVLDGYVQNANSAWVLIDGALVKYDATKHTADQRYSPNYNVEAVQMYAEANCGVLLDDLRLTIGNVYGR